MPTKSAASPTAIEPEPVYTGPAYEAGDRVRVHEVPRTGHAPDFARFVRLPLPGTVVGYVVRPVKPYRGVPVYEVYLPAYGSRVEYRADRLTGWPEAAPRLLCRMPGGRVETMEYRTHGLVSLSGDDPPMPRNPTCEDRARWEGTVLARYYRRHHPDRPREYWLAFPVGTTYRYERIDPFPDSPVT